ncbi:hypothetical protein LTR37_001301 [Vermiconidia calcicola]|uniref:Uncharacterized protein n=1 Tax=Vermiconidia calcicola TaxID=1690605 RepID=A0ACC3NWN3_9PEZI|nr:hypothetical protein LTR37_001301 [Vermiconidia calcicola]
MSKIYPPSISDGDMHTPSHKNSHRKAQGALRDNNKKPMKSNITNKVKSKHAGATPNSDSQGEDDDGDSSAIENTNSADEDADDFALSDDRQHDGREVARRLAGPELEDDDILTDISMTDAEQATGGAEQDNELSDDENYDDVDNVSDSEGSESETEDNVLRSAEEDLIKEFQKDEQRINAITMTTDMNEMAIHEDEALARRLSLQSSESQTDGPFAPVFDMDQDPFFGLSKDADEYTQMWNDAETALWRMPDTVRDTSDPITTNQKRVRFEETRSRSSSRSESEDPNDTFPDLLDASDHAGLKQQFELSAETEYGISYGDFHESESFNDFEDDDEKLAFQIDEASDSADETSSYDSDDEGDTTDEETAEEQIAKLEERKKAACKASADTRSTPRTPLLKRRAATPATRPGSTPRPVTPKEGKGPRTGTFAIDPTRASMTTDPMGRNIQILPPSRPPEKDRAFWERARTANSSRDGSPRGSFLTIPSPRADSIPPRPFTAQSTLGSMFNGNLDILRNNDTNNIAVEMFPAIMNRTQSSFTSFSATEDSDTDRQVDMDMQDFIHLDDSDSDSDGPPTGAIASPAESSMYSSFTPDGGRERRSSDLLDHFDQCHGAVGSFRRNQQIAKQVSSLASHPAKRASAHEYNALQKGRRGAANTPMTPARKKRASQDLTPSHAGVRKSISSPLAARRPRSRGNSLAYATPELLQTLGRSPFE